MDETARVVAQGYDAVADVYAGLEEEGAPWPRSRRVGELSERLPHGAHVLDLGCGNGVPVARDRVAAGYVVTGIDISAEHVRRARDAVPSATFEVADMRSLPFAAESFDGAVSLYGIEHVPRGEHGVVPREACRVLRPGGVLLLATEDSDEPGIVADWLGAPMFFSTSPAAETTRLVEQAGLSVIDTSVEAQVEAGREVPYLWVTAVRHPSLDQLH